MAILHPLLVLLINLWDSGLSGNQSFTNFQHSSTFDLSWCDLGPSEAKNRFNPLILLIFESSAFRESGLLKKVTSTGSSTRTTIQCNRYKEVKF